MQIQTHDLHGLAFTELRRGWHEQAGAVLSVGSRACSHLRSHSVITRLMGLSISSDVSADGEILLLACCRGRAIQKAYAAVWREASRGRAAGIESRPPVRRYSCRCSGDTTRPMASTPSRVLPTPARAREELADASRAISPPLAAAAPRRQGQGSCRAASPGLRRSLCVVALLWGLAWRDARVGLPPGELHGSYEHTESEC